MLTNQTSNQRDKWRYMGIIPAVGFMLLLFHTPANSSRAIPAAVPEKMDRATEFLFPDDGIPSYFPLPEKFNGNISFGYNKEVINPITKKEMVHKGIDMPAPAGTPVFAAGGGMVKRTGMVEGWGNLVVLEHAEGFTTFYAHLDEIDVQTGVKVAEGQVIGKAGNTGQSTGSHLHFEVRKNGENMNPEDFF